MKRWVWLILMVFVLTGAIVSVSLADIKGSHHDLNAYLGASGDTCYPCHGYRDRGGTQVAGLGRVGQLCWLRCHTASALTPAVTTLRDSTPEVGGWNAADNTLRPQGYSMTAASNKYIAHKLAKVALPAPDSETNWASSITSTFPYATDTQFTSIECTTCHDVHSNANAPFLRAPLSNQTTPGNAFCHQCHNAGAAAPARWTASLTTAPNGAHPSEITWDPTNSLLRTPAGNAGRRARRLEFKDTVSATSATAPAAVNDNGVFRNFSYYLPADLNNSANHYNPGGKLSDFAGAGAVGCYTCHATHLPSDAMIGGAATSQLTVARWRGDMNQTWARSFSEMCIGCHGAKAEPSNPGATQWFHPVDDNVLYVGTTANAGELQYRVTTPAAFLITVNVGVPATDCTDLGVGSRIVCSSCHGKTDATQDGVHATAGGKMILNPARSSCSACHSNVAYQAGTAPDSHHVYGGGAAMWTSTYQGEGYPQVVSYNSTNAFDNATLTNGLSCEDCHTFNGTAHNW